MLEVICTTVEDAVAAEAGGAERLELISRFDAGGLTPTREFVKQVLLAVRIPIRVMIREIENFQVVEARDRAAVVEKAREFSALPIDGIVCGFLCEDAVDHELLGSVIEATGDRRVTFHRAFEELSDPIATIGELKRYRQVDRILTSGGRGTLAEKISVLKECRLAAEPEITILAGGGMTDEIMSEVIDKAGIREFHFGTFVRRGFSIDGAVDAERVALVAGIYRR